MGYFWLPCPLCGEEFGGHEWGNDGFDDFDTIPTDDPAKRKGICPRCAEKRRKAAIAAFDRDFVPSCDTEGS